MSTNNSVNVSLSGNSGTGNFAGSTSPTFVTPTLGAATATSLAFSPTTNGIIGTTAANNASAGYVGEVISSQVTFASATSISSNVVTNLTSISLTAGDWDVWGNVFFVPAGTTTFSEVAASLSKVSATFGATVAFTQVAFGPGTNQGIVAPYLRVSVSSNQTVYLIAYTVFSVSTMKVCGMISARRIR